MSSKKNNKENNSSNHPLDNPLITLLYFFMGPFGFVILVFLLALL